MCLKYSLHQNKIVYPKEQFASDPTPELTSRCWEGVKRFSWPQSNKDSILLYCGKIMMISE